MAIRRSRCSSQHASGTRAVEFITPRDASMVVSLSNFSIASPARFASARLYIDADN